MIKLKIKDYEHSGKTFVIAEIGQAHDGSLGMLYSMIKAIADVGVDAVKFQIHIADAESSINEPFRVNFSYVDNNRYEYWKRMQLTFDHWYKIKKYCESLNVEFLATPFSNAAVDVLEKLKVNRYKLGSGDISNYLILEKILKTKKEIILSTGLGLKSDLDKTVKFLEKNKALFSILQCTTSYPTSPSDVNLSAIKDFKKRYNCPVGLSDHSGKIYAGLGAVALGAVIVEAHMTFDKRMFGPDSTSSLTVDEFNQLVQGIRYLEEARINNNSKETDENFYLLKNMFGRSLSVNKDHILGDLISFENLEGKKPADAGIPVSDYKNIIGKRLKQTKKKWDYLYYSDFE